MAMINISTDFDRERAGAYTLLVRVGSGENALAIVGDDQRLKLIATYHPGAVGKEVTDLMELDFAAVKLSLPGSRYAFIPEEVFEETAMQRYLRHFPDDGLAHTVMSEIAPLGIKVLHQTDRLGGEPFAARFQNMRTFSPVQALLHSITTYGLEKGGPVLAIDKQASTLIACFFNGNRFVYANDFEIGGAEDSTYYLYVILEHFGLEKSQLSLSLSGDITENDAIHQWAVANGNEAVFANSGELVHIAMPEELMPQQHRYLTLLGLHLCG